MIKATWVWRLVSLAVCGALVAACGEKPQVAAQGVRKGDTKAATGADPAYSVPGWKSGDEAGWQQQLKQRAQAQNEYVRVGAQKPGS